jgi:hypothetical protein
VLGDGAHHLNSRAALVEMAQVWTRLAEQQEAASIASAAKE